MPTDIENRFIHACKHAWSTVQIVNSMPPEMAVEELAIVTREQRDLDDASRALYELEKQADRGEIPALPEGIYNKAWKVYGELLDAHDRFCRRRRLHDDDVANIAVRRDLELVRATATPHYGRPV